MAAGKPVHSGYSKGLQLERINHRKLQVSQNSPSYDGILGTVPWVKDGPHEAPMGDTELTMPKVFFVHEKKSILVEQGLTILEAARRAGVTIESPCNAIGSCGKCRVHTGACSVLACQTPVEKDLAVSIPDYTGENQSLQILSRGSDFTYEKQPYISKRFLDGKTLVYGGETFLGAEGGTRLQNSTA